MVHRGEIVEKAIRNSGIPITQLAKSLGVSRRHMYNLFDNSIISWDVIIKIGRIIHYDFSNDFKEISKINKYIYHNENVDIDEVSEVEYKNAKYWKEKYFILLEKHYELLEKANNDLKK